MTKYKTVVVDYEGMQECMDQHSSQGWRLFCVNADTWRKVEGEVLGGPPQGSVTIPPDSPTLEEYSVSYYLLVFIREEDPMRESSFAEAIEELPHHERSRRSY